MNVLFSLTLCFFILSLLPHSTLAVSYTFTGLGDGSTFNSNANWSPSTGFPSFSGDQFTIPATGFNVIIPSSLAFTIGSFTLGDTSSLTINPSSTLTITSATSTINGLLTIIGPSSKLNFNSATPALTISSTGIVNVTKSASITSSGVPTITNNGLLTTDSNTTASAIVSFAPAILNSGSISINSACQFQQALTNTPTGLFYVSANITAKFTGGTSSLNGTFSFGDPLSSQIENAGATLNVYTYIPKLVATSGTTNLGSTTLFATTTSSFDTLHCNGGNIYFFSTFNINTEFRLTANAGLYLNKPLNITGTGYITGGTITYSITGSILTFTSTSNVTLQLTSNVATTNIPWESYGIVNWLAPSNPTYMVYIGTWKHYGTFNSGASGTVTTSGSFSNYGTINVSNNGNLKFASTFSHLPGTSLITIDTGATLSFTGGGQINNTISVPNSNTSAVVVSGGTMQLHSGLLYFTITGGIVSFPANYTATSFDFLGGNIYVDKTVTVTDTLTIRGGSFSYQYTPGGQLVAENHCNIQLATDYVYLYYITLVTKGTTNLTATGVSNFYHQYSSVWKNYGVVNVFTNARRTVTGGSGDIYNYGTVNIQGNGTIWNTGYRNFGTTYIADYPLELAAGGLQNGTVTFNNTGASLILTGNTHQILNGVSTLYVDGGIAWFSNNYNLTFLQLTSGSLYVDKITNVTDLLVLKSGSISYSTTSGQLVAENQCNFQLVNFVYLNYITLVTKGITNYTVTPNYYFYHQYSSVWKNYGVVNVRTDIRRLVAYGPGDFYNYGTVNIQGNGTVWNAGYRNFGTTYIANYPLELAGGGLQNGTVTFNNTGASLILTGNTHQILGGISTLYVDGGIAWFPNNYNLTFLQLTSGSLYVDQITNVTDLLVLKSGTITYSNSFGQLVAETQCSLQLTNYIFLNFITFVTKGFTNYTVTPNYYFYHQYSSVWKNYGVVNVRTDIRRLASYGSGDFYNYGTVNVQGNGTVWNAGYRNFGTTYIADYPMELAGGGLQNGTVTFNNTGASLILTGNTHQILSGISTLYVDGGIAWFSNNYNLTFLQLTSGSLYVDQITNVTDLLVLKSGTITYSNSFGQLVAETQCSLQLTNYIFLNFITFVTKGFTNYTVTPNYYFYHQYSSVWKNYGVVNIRTDTRRLASYGSGDFYNYGTVNIQGNGTVWNAGYRNLGTTYIADYPLELAAGGLQNGTIAFNNTGARLILTGGTHQILSGISTLYVDGGGAWFSNNYIIDFLQLTSGTIIVDKTTTVTSLLVLQSGTITYSNSFGQLVSENQCNIQLTHYLYLNYITLILAGTTNYTSNNNLYFVPQYSAVWKNYGVVNVRTDARRYVFNGNGDFQNYAIVNIQGNGTMWGAGYTNYGVTFIADNFLELAAGGLQNGSVVFNNTGGRLKLTGGTHQIVNGIDSLYIDGGTAWFSGNYIIPFIQLISGAVTVDKTVNVTNQFVLNSGTITYSNTIGVLSIENQFVIDFINYAYMNYITLITRGTVQIPPSPIAYYFYLQYASLWRNFGTMNITTPARRTILTGAVNSMLYHYGTMDIYGSGTIFGLPFYNNGTINIYNTTLELEGGGTQIGIVTLSTPTADIWFTGGTHTISKILPSLYVTGGSVVLSNSYSFSRGGLIGGTLSCDKPTYITSSFVVSGGTLTYSSTIGSLILTGSANSTLSPTSVFTLNVPFYNYGLLTWASTSGITSIFLSTNGFIVNYGTFSCQKDGVSISGSGYVANYVSLNVFNNIAVSVPLRNYATFVIESGTITLSATPLIAANSTTIVKSAGTLAYSGVTVTYPTGSNLQGCGTITSTSTATFNGKLTLGCSSADATLDFTGSLTFTSSAFVVVNFYPGPIVGKLAVTAAVNLASSNLTIDLLDGYTFTSGNVVNANIVTSTTRTGTFVLGSFGAVNLTPTYVTGTVTLSANATGTCSNCSSITGTCNPIYSTCVCNANYYGNSCECPGNATHACSGHGSCDTSVSSCTCDLGYWGNTCQNTCPGGVGASTCNGHGTCSPINGQCTCSAGYGGADCLCPSNSLSNYCSNHGSCNVGACHCYNGYYGTNCSGICPGGVSNPCNFRGSCDQVLGTCDCSGSGGYTGAACEIPPPVSSTSTSSYLSSSAAPTSSFIPSITPSSNSQLVSTSTPLSSIPSTNTPVFSSTPLVSSTPVSSSSSIASSVTPTPTPTTCPNGYWNPNGFCNKTCPGGAATPCNNRGNCNPINGVCTCTDLNYDGADCNCPAREGVACSGRGSCLNGVTCTCSSNAYGGPACECPAKNGNVCSGHGVCAANGVCHCDPGYWGLDCSVSCSLPSSAPCNWCDPTNSCPYTPTLPLAMLGGSASGWPSYWGHYSYGTGSYNFGAGGGGNLVISTAGNAINYWCASNAVSVDFTTGFSIELSIRVVSSDLSNCIVGFPCVGSFSAVAVDASTGAALYFSLGHNIVSIFNGVNTTFTQVDTLSRHTYLFSINASSSNQLVLDYDGETLFNSTLPGYNSLSNTTGGGASTFRSGSFCMGDTNADASGETSLRYAWFSPTALGATSDCDVVPNASNQSDCSAANPQCYWCGASSSCYDVLASNITSCFAEAAASESVVLFPLPMSASQKEAIQYATGALDFFIVFLVALAIATCFVNFSEAPQWQSDAWSLVDRVQRIASMSYFNAKLPQTFIAFCSMLTWINFDINITGSSFKEFEPVTGRRRLLELEQIAAYLDMDERKTLFNTLAIVGVLLLVVIVVAVVVLIGTTVKLCCNPKQDRKLSRAAKLRGGTRNFLPATLLRVLALSYYGIGLSVFAQLSFPSSASYDPGAFAAAVVLLVFFLTGFPLLYWFIVKKRNELDEAHKIKKTRGEVESKLLPKPVARYDKRYGVAYNSFNAFYRTFGVLPLLRKLVFAVVLSVSDVSLRAQIGACVGANGLVLVSWLFARPFTNFFEFVTESIGAVLDSVGILLLLAYDPNNPSDSTTAADTAIILSYVAIVIQGLSVFRTTYIVLRDKLRARRERKQKVEFPSEYSTIGLSPGLEMSEKKDGKA